MLKFYQKLSNYSYFYLDSFDPNPTTRHTVFSVVIGGFFYWASLLCVNQSTVQKAMSLRNLSKAKIALTLSVFGLATVFLINFYTGLMTFAKYGACDPLKTGQIDAIDQLVPFYVMDTFGHFTTFVGIFVAGIFAASLGTVAACLSSLSAVTIEDLLISGLNFKMTPERSTRYAKWMNFGYGVASFGLIFLVEGRGVLQATLTLNGLVGGILLGLFTLGIFFERANLKGALYGGLLAMVCVLTLGGFALTSGVDEPFLDTSTDGCSCAVDPPTTPAASAELLDLPWYQSIHKVSYMWYSMIGTLLTILFGLTISLLTQFYNEKKMAKFSPSTQQSQDNKSIRNSMTATSRKLSTIFQTIVQDVTETTANKLHLHHQKATEQINISNDETVQVGEANLSGPSVIGIFAKNNSSGIDNPAMIRGDEKD